MVDRDLNRILNNFTSAMAFFLRHAATCVPQLELFLQVCSGGSDSDYCSGEAIFALRERPSAKNFAAGAEQPPREQRAFSTFFISEFKFLNTQVPKIKFFSNYFPD